MRKSEGWFEEARGLRGAVEFSRLQIEGWRFLHFTDRRLGIFDLRREVSG